ncbi:MAG: T9SS type A sorting domain-containing protein [Fibrobacteres bacterium]|nr:T9SS type A sorting domain-containing protein [Fibrobacterota bacterium]
MNALLVLIFAALSIFAIEGRNVKLREMAEKSWINVCKYGGAVSTELTGGTAEVPWSYDQQAKVFVRVGGCTGGYTNTICFFDLGTETVSFPWPKDLGTTVDTSRPGSGCNRGVCYDPYSKLTYTSCGGAASDYGVYGFWKGDMVAKKWTRYAAGSKQMQGQCAADTANRIIVSTWRNSAGLKECGVYEIDNNTFVKAPAMPNTSNTVSSNFAIDWWQTLEYAPALNGTMYFGYMYKDSINGYYKSQWITWLFDGKTRKWTDLKPTGLEGVPLNYVSQGFRPVLSWDPVANVMILLINGVGLFTYSSAQNRWNPVDAGPLPGGSQMFEYDPEHNVHVLVKYNYSFDQDVWAFRYQNKASTFEEKAALSPKHTLLVSMTPSPVTTSAVISYQVAEKGNVELTVYDIKGRAVLKPVARQNAEAGIYSKRVQFNDISAGVYAAILTNGTKKTTLRVIVAK